MNFDDYTPPDWHQWFLQGVYWIASKSKDNKTKIGSIIVKNKRIISTGYNGIPEGVNDEVLTRLDRPEKYFWFEHSERNAIYSAARHGIITNDSTLYTNAFPCADCARGIIQAGITNVYVHKQFNDISDICTRDQWKGHNTVTSTLFSEAGIEIFSIDAVLGCKAYFDGKIYNV